MPEEVTEQGATMKSYEDLTEAELDQLTKAASPAELEARKEKREADGEVNRLFMQLKKLTDAGHRFTDTQMDAGIRLFFHRLEPQEVGWINEISKSVMGRPLWQLFAGWYRQVQEQGMATGAVFDPSWESRENGGQVVEMSICGQCVQEFKPSRHGQVYCSNKCGADHEKANPPQQATTAF